ncbi:metal ABC transporter permease [bacterium]|nr:metal ABC transporter permease [bacterium]
MEFFNSLFTVSFLRNALLAGLMASIVCGVMGSLVVVKRISFVSGAIAHSVLGGIGIAYFLNISPTIGTFVFAVFAALLISIIKQKKKENEDTVLSAFWAIGMAIGIIFMSMTPGYNSNLMSYLFGNILLVTTTDLWSLLALLFVIIITVVVFYRQFIAMIFDEEFARLKKIKVNFLYTLLLILISLSVVILIRVVGIILVIALLTLPAAISRLFNRSIGGMMLWASILGLIFTLLGLWLSYLLNLPTGSVIIVLAGLTYISLALMKSH